MLAASFWSLLQPAIDLARTVDEVKSTDSMGNVCYFPAAVGLLVGAIFIILVDYFFPEQDLIDDGDLSEPDSPVYSPIVDNRLFARLGSDAVRYRGNDFVSPLTFYKPRISIRPPRVGNRVWLFLVAITVHNIPEGLAVGVAFGTGNGSAAGSALLRARNLALGMAIQNVPEGLAVSLPMRAAGYSFWQSFWYGQLSGIVEPLAGILGCITVQYVHPLQPYALGFAAGAMIFVIFDDVIPEAHRKLCFIDLQGQRTSGVDPRLYWFRGYDGFGRGIRILTVQFPSPSILLLVLLICLIFAFLGLLTFLYPTTSIPQSLHITAPFLVC